MDMIRSEGQGPSLSLEDSLRVPPTGDSGLTLEARGLGKSFGQTWIWRDLSFEIHPGSRTAITGPSGSGKTLLMRTLSGLEPVHTGCLFFHGQDLKGLSMPAYRATVMYLAQKPAFVEGTVIRNLKKVFGFRVHQGRGYDQGFVLSLLEAAGKTKDFLSRHVQDLSGGEAQIAAVVRVLQLDPEVLLLDEPTASLDSGHERRIEDVIHAWHGQNPRRASIWTSHNRDQLSRTTDLRLNLEVQREP